MADKEKLWADFDTASRQLDYFRTKSQGGGSDEKAYAQAYTRLVKAGHAPKLRVRYRC